MFTLENARIGIVGLGYVGLPLACLFAKKYPVRGFDLNSKRVKELKSGWDSAEDIKEETILRALASGMKLYSDANEIADCNVFIVAVPTPVDTANRPVLSPIIRASTTVAKMLKKGDTVIYESTVYPGLTEEVCVPILERISKMKYNEDFYVGYSPERVCPGDKQHPIEQITKVTSGSTPEAAKRIDELYSSVLENGTHLAPSIKVAEAAKIIENAQRDVNIAFVNEMATLFATMGIDTHSVLQAAQTKWNFHSYCPGLVGGHCIGVDPYYLIHRADQLGVNLQLLKGARSINASMGNYVADRVMSHINERKSEPVNPPRVLLLGFTFKEDCRDLRNTRVADILYSLERKGAAVTVYDPVADPQVAHDEYGVDTDLSLETIKSLAPWDAIVYCVDHRQFRDLDIPSLCDENTIVFDVKGGVNKESIVTERL